MLSKIMKKTFVFSIITIGILGFFLSCENPFTNNMGAKVVRALPTITVASPIPGEFIEGEVTFSGEATADRSIHSVEVRIFPQPQILPDGTTYDFAPAANWTTDGVVFTSGGTKTEWSYTLNTLTFGSTTSMPGFADGMLKIQFRTRDNVDNYGTSNENVYVIKNFGPEIRLTFPNVNAPPSSSPRLITGSYLRGQVIDARGLHPDYPQIKIWDAGDPEPGEEGWARLFLTGYDDPVGSRAGRRGAGDTTELEGYYSDERSGTRLLAAQFVFKLDEFTIDPDTRKVRYAYAVDIQEGVNKHSILPPARQYNFKIRTSDTYFDENLVPIVVTEGSESYIPTGNRGFFPPKYFFETAAENDSRLEGDPLSLNLIRSDEVPVIVIDNSDIAENDLLVKPNIYISETNNSKIYVPARSNFRLRVGARHSIGVDHAILSYEHVSTGRSGFLMWDDTPGGEGYVDPTNDATKASQGYKGWYPDPLNPGIESWFTFTDDGLPGTIFTPSADPYVLKVFAVTEFGHERTVEYRLVLDGTGPMVRVLSVVGATGEPSSADFGSRDNATNDSPFTVNGNVQVSVSRTDDSGIMLYLDSDPNNLMGEEPPGDGYYMVKWIVDELVPTDALSVQRKIDGYRSNPARANLEFFYDIGNSATSGFVTPTDNDFSFKFRAWKPNSITPSTNDWNNQTLYLYVIAEDRVQNLGFIRQQIFVDDSSDTPVLEVPVLKDTSVAMPNMNALKVTVTVPLAGDTVTGNLTRNGNWEPRVNVLEGNDIIEMNFSDDDGILPVEDDAAAGLIITLTNLNVTPPFSHQFTVSNLEELLGASLPDISVSGREWRGRLTPALMAKMMYGSNTAETALRAGYYHLEIKVIDNIGSKIIIGNDAPDTETTESEFYFAVYTGELDRPSIPTTDISPGDNSTQNTNPVDVTGTVRSRFDIQHFLISFDPNVITPPFLPPSILKKKLALAPVGDQPDEAGYYNYTWTVPQVNFGNIENSDYGMKPERKFELFAYDWLGNEFSVSSRVQVDTEPPQISVNVFADGRTVDVNGKVEFFIRASDPSGMKDFGNLAAFKWWVLPNSAADPFPGTEITGAPAKAMFENYPSPSGSLAPGGYPNGIGDQPLITDNESGGLYRVVFDSRVLPDSQFISGVVNPSTRYTLWAAAVDSADNYRAVRLNTFTVRQSADNPSLVLITPPDGVDGASIRSQGNLVISGSFVDDDLFAKSRTSGGNYIESLNSYIQIRFPRDGNNPNDPASWSDDDWINAPTTFNSLQDLSFALNIEAFTTSNPPIIIPNLNTYFSTDGVKHYQLKVRDEPDWRPDAGDPAPEDTNFGKNPIRVESGAPIVPNGGLGAILSTERVYPRDDRVSDPIKNYRFYLDNHDPEIVFYRNDPDQARPMDEPDDPNHPRERPVFNSKDELLAVLNGTALDGGVVVEANLVSLVVRYGAVTRTLVEGNTPLENDTQRWQLVLADLAAFDAAGQGMQSITFEAIDIAGNAVTKEWSFYKDTRGPDILTTPTRAIDLPSAVTFPIPGFPGDWPGDWPNGSAWKTDTGAGWATLRTTYGLGKWPAEWASLNQAGIEAAYANALLVTPSVISGDPQENSGNTGYSPPTIRGKFQDVYSAIGLDSAATKTFEYRFNNPNGRMDTSWTYSKTIENPAGTSADWSLSLDSALGFTGPDGKVTVDIKVVDALGNESALYGLMIRLDRYSPYFGTVGTPTPNSPDDIGLIVSDHPVASGNPLVEYQRVFRSTGADGDRTIVFELEGHVYDANLKELSATISRSGGSAPKVEAYFDIDKGADNHFPSSSDGNPDKVNGTEETGLLDPNNHYRLTVTPTSNEGEYKWRLMILETDVWLLSPANGQSGEGIPRFVRLVAKDKARNETGSMTWNFYLDGNAPEITFTNLVVHSTTTAPPIVDRSFFESPSLVLTGNVSDATNVRKLQYRIGRYDYGDNPNSPPPLPPPSPPPTLTPLPFKYYNSGAWSSIDVPLIDWPSALGTYNPGNPQGTVAWSLGNTTELIALFTNAKEGLYQIEFVATDWALGGGNVTSVSVKREFYYDASLPAVIPNVPQKTYYHTDTSNQLGISFKVEDNNLIDSVEVEVRNTAGTTVVPRTAAALVPQFSAFSDTNWGLYNATVNLHMVQHNNGIPSSNPLPGGSDGDDATSYTLVFYVKDSVGREASGGTTTQRIMLDNTPPEVNPTKNGPSTPATTIVGNILIQGNSTDNSSQFNKLAFYVRNSESSTAWAAGDFSNPSNLNNPSNNPNGWHYYDSSETNGGPYRLIDSAENPTQVLVQIGQGINFWTIEIPHTRNFSSPGSRYVQWDTGSSYGFPGLGNEAVGKLIIDVLLEDLAGNFHHKELEYYIHTESDRPRITAVQNPQAEGLLNGTIRISGTAEDNERVNYVWFRVLDDNVGEAGYGNPYNLDVPVWNTNTWEPYATLQTPVAFSLLGNMRIDPPTLPDGGWYMANRGGENSSDKTVNWWAIINVQGELESGTFNKIKIEFRVADTTAASPSGWVAQSGYVSKNQAVSASVVKGVPVFGEEKVKEVSSASSGVWESMLAASIRKTAGYKVTISHPVPLGAIRWTRTAWNATRNGNLGGFVQDGSSINLLNPGDPYNAVTYSNDVQRILGTLNDGIKPGMAAKVEPLNFVTGSFTVPGASTDPAKMYIIWEWNDAFIPALRTMGYLDPEEPDSYYYSTNPLNWRNTGITLASGSSQSIGSGKLMQQNSAGNFEWEVIVDVNTAQLEEAMYAADPKYGQVELYPERIGQVRGSIYYPVYLTASDNSVSLPLTGSKVSLLPIDNNPPRGEFTLNRRPAGTAQPIGGEAGDDGPVSGVRRVILWFSRETNGVRNSVSWKDQSVTSFKGYNTNTSTDGWSWAETLISDGVFASLDTNETTLRTRLPYIPNQGSTPAEPSTSGTGGDYAVVVDTSATMNPVAGYGHSLLMGFTVGGMGRMWYFNFNSEEMVSGPVTLHYVVIDRAGNGKYYEDPLVIMNYAPLISGIRLGTDIRGVDWSGYFSGNASYSTATGATGSMGLISSHTDWSPADTDYTKGILDFSSTSLSPDRLIDFNVRNNLLALRVETAQEPGATTLGEHKSRSFRLEYVSGARRVTDIKEVRKGQVYVVDSEPSFTTAKLGGLGAAGDGPWPRGSAFLAAVDGNRNKTGNPIYDEPVISGEVVLWELNDHVTYDIVGNRDTTGIPSALKLSDVPYSATATSAKNAEFVYTSGAFNGSSIPAYGQHIIDFTFGAEYPPVGGWPANNDQMGPPRAHSLFILRVFDGPEKDLFGTFALIRIRVNNNDNTPPFAQLYDINPYTEGQVRQQTQQRSLAPMSIGANRTRGGLWNTNTGFNWNVITKSGHVEPRAITGLPSPYSTYKHTLTPAQMGGSAYAGAWDNSGGTVNPNAFYEVDTVSGRVILRGYAEEDQRIQQVDLVFTPSDGGASHTVTILEEADNTASGGDPANYEPATTGFLKVPAAQDGKVYFHDTADVRRHSVEWAYVWETDTTPQNFIVGSINVRAVAYNMNDAPVDLASTGKVSGILEAGETTGETAQEQQTSSDSVTNPGFPVGLYKYNTINFNVRPYMTGIRRDQSKSYHNNRSLQGRVALSRGETIAITGFNLGGGGTTTTLSLPGAAGLATSTVNSTQQSNYQLESMAAYRSRILSSAIPVGATTTAGNNLNGAVRLIVASSGDSFYAVNTRVPNNANGERPLLNTDGDAVDSGGSHWIQPWNTESSAGIEGSDLWDDFTSVHIWSGGVVPANNSEDNAYFRSRNDNWAILNPSMSINPRNGVLHASHNEGGGEGGNTGTLKRSTNAGNAGPITLMRFVDPIIHSDIYYSPGTSTPAANEAVTTSDLARAWSVTSIIGRYASNNDWGAFGGVWVKGPTGTSVSHGGFVDDNNYYVESTYYNASPNTPGAQATPPSTDQFLNPHVVTSIVNGQEYIHVSYYDSKDRSLKYRFNQKGSPGTINNTSAARAWVNLDGSFDEDDYEVVATTAQNFTLSELLDGVTPSGATSSQDYWLTRQNGLFIIPSGTGVLYYSTETAYRVGNGTTTTDPPSGRRYILEVHTANGEHVTQGDKVYTLGDYTGANATEYIIYALSTGTISGVRQSYSDGNTSQHWLTGAGSSSNNSYSITPDAALNYVREVLVANNTAVKQGTPVYVVGENPLTVPNTTRETFEFLAAADGTITNLVSVGTQVANTVNNVGVAGGSTAQVTAIITGTNGASGERLYTINPRIRNNFLRDVGIGIGLNNIVAKGDTIWTLGPTSNAYQPGGIYTFYYAKAPISGRITSMPASNTSSAVMDGSGNWTNFVPVTGNVISITPINTVESSRVVLGRTTPSSGVVPAPYSYDRYMELDTGVNSPNYPNNTTGAPMMQLGSVIDAGEHNAIAIAYDSLGQGCPVIAYYDNTNQRLKMAVSTRPNPTTKNDWVIRDYVIPPTDPLSYQTGQFVSMRIDNGARDSGTKNTVHIAAFNSQGSYLVYIKGQINPPSSGNAWQDNTTANNVFTIAAGYPKVVDSVGVVGRWSTISLDEDGDPWIAYMDEMNRGSMDGAKIAYYKPSLYKKTQTDMYGRSVTGWETMHVPALYRVENQIFDGRENGRLGFENFPTRNFQATTGTRFWSGALGYVGTGAGPDAGTAFRTRYRIAYYVK